LTDSAKAFGAEGVISEMQEPTMTMFKQSPKIATYLLAIVAGPYKHVAMNE
jgi:aminopeptidase N